MLLFVTPSERFSYSDAVFIDQFDVQVTVGQTRNINIPLPNKTLKNGTLFLHAFLTKKTQKKEWTLALQDPSLSYTAAPISLYQVPVEETFNLIREKNERVKSSHLNCLKIML